jgi:MFS family permease
VEQWKIIIFTTLAISLEGMHFNILGMILIPFKNFYQLTDSEIQLISGVMYLSVGLGSFLSGHIIKRYPRTEVINYSILCTFILHLLLGLVQSVFLFTVLRILIGFVIGVFIPLITNLLCEYCPIHRRSFVFNSTWAGYNFGCLAFAFSQLFLMPELEEEYMQRTLLFTSIFPLTVFIILKFYLNDSPRNMILLGKEKEAFDILEKFKGGYLENNDRNKIMEDVKHGVNRELGGHFKDLFKRKYRKITILLIFIWFSVYMLYYGPFLIISWVIKAIGEGTAGHESNRDVILDEIRVYLIGLVGYFLGGSISEIKFFGRKKGIIFGLFFCILFTLAGINFPQYFVTFFGIYFIFLNIPLIVIDIYSCELYPTKIRDVAVGFFFSCCRLGSCLASFLYVDFFRLGTFVPFYAVILTCMVDIGLMYCIPYETFGAALDTNFSQNHSKKKEKLLNDKDFAGFGNKI